MESEATDERPFKRARLSPVQDDTNDKIDTNKSFALNGSSTAVPSDVMTESKETEIGVTAYVSNDTIPFNAFLKTRYTDFLVNEILPNGQVVHLTSTKVSASLHPPKDDGPEKDFAHQTNNGDMQLVLNQPDEVTQTGEAVSLDFGKTQVVTQESNTGKIAEDDKQKLISYFNETAFRQLLSLYQSILKNPEKKSKDHPVVRTEFTADRSARGEIHAAIRRIFASKIDSSTDHDGTLVLTAANPNSRYNRPNNNNKSKPSWKPGKLGWQERGGEYLHFTLYKENKDTMESISWLTRIMKVTAKSFQFAGTKDKRAVTAQRVSAYRIDADRLAAQNRTLRNAAVGDFEYHPQGLELGDLTGNEFTITLRDCRFSEVSGVNSESSTDGIKGNLQKALTNLSARGFLNYYGLQRFGTFASRTDTTGLHILKGDFQAACKAILEYDASILDSRPAVDETNPKHDRSDDYQRALALHMYQKDNNLHKAIETLPKKFSAESTLIRHLHKQPSDYLGALMNIPRNLRLMYVHAYQSLVWNHAVTHRWNLHGDKVVEGDLVLVHEHKDKEHSSQASGPAVTNGSAPAALAEDQEAEVDADGELIIHPPSHDRANIAEDMFERARPLSEAEASLGQYSISDIVLPLPGYDVVYPSDGEFYKQFMSQNGNLDPHDMRRKQRDFSLSGSYRKMIARVKLNQDAEGVEVYKYRKDEEQFVKTDMEILKVKETGSHSGEKGKDRGWGEIKAEGQAMPQLDVEKGPEKIAVVLRFQLGSSQYATMALRELSRGGVVQYKPDFSIGR